MHKLYATVSIGSSLIIMTPTAFGDLVGSKKNPLLVFQGADHGTSGRDDPDER